MSKHKGKIRTLTDEEAKQAFHNKAMRTLGVSGDEFVEGWKSGKYGWDYPTPEVSSVAILLPWSGADY